MRKLNLVLILATALVVISCQPVDGVDGLNGVDGYNSLVAVFIMDVKC